MALRNSGVKIGDRVGAYIPNCPEAVIGMLATTSIGAIWSSASPDFGVSGVLDRFLQITPKILFSVNAVVYNGKIWDHLVKVNQVVQGLPSLEKVVIVTFVNQNYDLYLIVVDMNQTSREYFLLQVLDLKIPEQPNLKLKGKPKCIVHSGPGSLIQHKKEHIIHASMTRDDVFLYYTTTGWMMWNWLVSALSVGCTIVLYEGSPFKATPARLWDIVDQFEVSIFGTSAKYLQTMEELKLNPMKTHSLTNLRILYSTGSPLKPESFDYVYSSIKRDVCLGSITGGTDIVSLFAGHNTALPVHKGEIQCRCLGMSIYAWDESGKVIYDKPGDLVCTKPFPCMPVMFWNDPNSSIYQSAYFSQIKGVWYHGDYISVNSITGGVVMLGRSDGTLNPAG
ncbi:hypothetical protein HK096_007734, partial [Nowakowskiella sp. JEL0078]